MTKFKENHPIELIRGDKKPSKKSALKSLAIRLAWIVGKLNVQVMKGEWVGGAENSGFARELRATLVAIEALEEIDGVKEKLEVLECEKERAEAYKEAANMYQRATCSPTPSHRLATLQKADELLREAEKLDPEFDCETCEDTGVVDGPISCNVVPSECCGGCYSEEACPDCDGGDRSEPDYDAMRDDLIERDAIAAEVEWESPK